MDRGYKSRRSGFRRPITKIIIVCEGETECIYFNNYRERKNGVEVKPFKNSKNSPVSLMNCAKDKWAGLSPKEGDQVWCVFDADENSKEQLEKAQKLAKENNIKIGFSNPRFELWYLLHYRNLNADNYQTGKEVENKLNDEIPKYDKTRNYFPQLEQKQQDAIKRAKQLEQEHIKKCNEIVSTNSNPSTQVFHLVEQIQKIIEKNKLNAN